MVNFCPNCGQRVSSKQDAMCMACGQPLPLPTSASVWEKLLRLLGLGFRKSVTRRSVERIHLDQTTKYVWTDPATGKECTATSPEDVPADVRRQLASFSSRSAVDDLGSASGTSFVFRDASGQERRYTSLAEMPPDVRELFERYARKHGGMK